MERLILLSLLLLSFIPSKAQIILFQKDPGTAEALYRCTQSEIGLCVDSLRIDTIYTENISTGELEMVIQRYPLSRYEFFTDGAIYRRVDIQQLFLSDPSIETINVGEVVQGPPSVIDIPNGAYHEFFPNGNIRIKGTLDGYNADGTLKKTGEWREWDASGKVMRQESHP